MNDKDRSSTEITIGSDNIFADLGLPNAGEMLIKAQLARAIYIWMTARQLTQTDAAKILGIDRSEISNLIDGKLAAFSIERLFRFLNALDCDVEITIKAKPIEHPTARVVVLS
jgi:predicted XRE-type DNA-binding protein